MKKFSVNQIVRGINCGVFFILGFTTRNNILFAILKEINPANLTDFASGELQLPVDAIIKY